MSKELREMLQKLEQMKAEVRALLGEDKVDEAEKRMEEVRALQKKIEVQRQLEEEERGGLGLGGGYSVGGETRAATKEDAELEREYRQIFMKAIRRRPVSSDERSIIAEYEKRAVMNEGGTNPAIPDGDSSLIVPKDIQTRIYEVMRAQNDLSQYVRVEEVTTLSGSRVLEKDETMTPFALIDEYGVLPETDNPKFVAVSYSVKKRGGILPITNELLTDSDQNIINYITRWIGKKAVVTRNKLITDLLLTMTPKDLADLKAVKKVFNVDLDPAISLSSIVLTNQDGYNWLDSQQDANGRFLLQDDITQPGRKLMFGRPVVVCSNRYLPSITGTTNKAPIFIGNLEELIVLFTRRFFELAATKEGGDAFKRDTTDLRTIMRDDIKFWDTGAAVYGQLALS
ncbi:phage major capsid protein [Geobacillus stearothermophilus]|uniref:phage major capsid protein n=1 Tax=Geobacillus stearothermophilus TaxID=1422 RepID=UPI002E1D2692|nr:phage major capsid protein [Geobacillus stearothermophilus]MED3777994.1 phage major capsid protein [Geobacillus stearothermophilus]MED4830634.1 phage major capsid protein [Geobacillus stearothermophilus]MED4960320.1 phage major capsid protein [Geobacillus stearothermophilus]